jgi:23S rRNA pseudouridine2605 synthase
MRLQRALARAGVASRRAADALVAEGRVTVNGAPAEVGQVVNPARDVIAVDGQPMAAVAPREWLVLHKPAGVLTTRADPEGRPTVFDLVPDRPGLTYVGRLDFMTEGVLLFTTDGEAAHRLTHPSRAVERTYVAVVRGNAPAAVRTLRHGLVLDDGTVEATAVDARPLGNRRWEFELTIAEGRNREVRRICEALELVVERLARVRFGPVRLGALALGEVRSLNVTERRVIDALTGADTPIPGEAGAELRAVGRAAASGRRTTVGDARDKHANARPASRDSVDGARPGPRRRPTDAAGERPARNVRDVRDARAGRESRAGGVERTATSRPRGGPERATGAERGGVRRAYDGARGAAGAERPRRADTSGREPRPSGRVPGGKRGR